MPCFDVDLGRQQPHNGDPHDERLFDPFCGVVCCLLLVGFSNAVRDLLGEFPIQLRAYDGPL